MTSEHAAQQMYHEIRYKAKAKAVLPVPCPYPGCRNPLLNLDQPRAVNHLAVAELTVLKVQEVLYIYIELVGNQFQNGKAIVLKLHPQSQNRWVFSQKQTGELTR